MSTPEKDESAVSAVAVADTGTADTETGTADTDPGTADTETGTADTETDTDVAAGTDSAQERRPRWWVAWLIRLVWLPA